MRIVRFSPMDLSLMPRDTGPEVEDGGFFPRRAFVLRQALARRMATGWRPVVRFVDRPQPSPELAGFGPGYQAIEEPGFFNRRAFARPGKWGPIPFEDRPQEVEEWVPRPRGGAQLAGFEQVGMVLIIAATGQPAPVNDPVSRWSSPTFRDRMVAQGLAFYRPYYAWTTPRPARPLRRGDGPRGAQLQGLSIKKALNWVKKNKTKVIVGAAVVGGAYWAQKQAGGWSQLLTKEGWSKVGTAVKAIPSKVFGSKTPTTPAGVTTSASGIYTGGGAGGGALDTALNIAGKVVQVGASAMGVASAAQAMQGPQQPEYAYAEPPNLYNQAMAATGGAGHPASMAADLMGPPQLLGQDPNTGELVYSNGTRTPPPMQGGAVVEVGDSYGGGTGGAPAPSSGFPKWVAPVAMAGAALVLLLAVKGGGTPKK